MDFQLYRGSAPLTPRVVQGQLYNLSKIRTKHYYQEIKSVLLTINIISAYESKI